MITDIQGYAISVEHSSCPKRLFITQGTVLGPLLFLLHINKLPQIVSSQVRLFGRLPALPWHSMTRWPMTGWITHDQIAVLTELFKIYKPVRQLCAKHKYNCHTTELKTFFAHHTIPEWNSFIAYVAEAETLTSFESQLVKLKGPSTWTTAPYAQHLSSALYSS